MKKKTLLILILRGMVSELRQEAEILQTETGTDEYANRLHALADSWETRIATIEAEGEFG